MNAGCDAAVPVRWIRTFSVLLLVLLPLLGCGDELTSLDPDCGRAEPLILGTTQVADLRPGSDPVLDGTLVDYYSVQVPGAGTLVVEMAAEAASSQVDPYLYLWADDDGDPVAQAYDPTGEGTLRTAQLAHPVAAGCYRVGASGWPAAAQGGYTIRATFTP